jgi:hypothetical protein
LTNVYDQNLQFLTWLVCFIWIPIV